MNSANLLAGSIAFGLSLVLTPIVKRLSFRLRLYDLPGPLKIHSRPIPRLGGVAIALAFEAGVAIGINHADVSAWPVFAAFFIVWVTGLADDIRRLSPLFRFVAQISAATIMWYSGWRLPWISAEISNLLGTCLFVVLFINATNFLDGADGLAAGVSIVISLAYLALPPGRESLLGIAVGWSLLGACAGFLVFNFPPASIFMGDSGSTVLGFAVAFLGLDFYRAGAAARVPPFFPLIVAAIPVLDAAFAIMRRLRGRCSPTQGDREHFYDLLLARGWSPRNVVFVCCGLTALLAVAGRLTVATSISRAFLICVFCFGGLLAAGLKLGSLRPQITATAARISRERIKL